MQAKALAKQPEEQKEAMQVLSVSGDVIVVAPLGSLEETMQAAIAFSADHNGCRVQFKFGEVTVKVQQRGDARLEMLELQRSMGLGGNPPSGIVAVVTLK